MILEGDGICLKAGDSHHYKPIDSTSINGARSKTKVVEHCLERERENPPPLIHAYLVTRKPFLVT